MTTREQRTLTIALLGLIGVLGVGFLAYFLVVNPYITKSRAIEKLEGDVNKRILDIEEIQAAMRKYEKNRRQSLPADVKLSRGKYADLLNNMIRKADFAPGYKIVSAEPNAKAAPVLPGKKPAYTLLSYEVSGKADYYHVLDFLQNFYAQPLLHSIKKVNVVRPTDARARERRELDVTMTIEAIVMDNAYDRPVLLPSEPQLTILSGGAPFAALNLAPTQVAVPVALAPADVLATPARTYLAAASKNLFFGPTTERKKDTIERPAVETPAQEDSAPFIILTSVVGYSDGKIVATLRDKLTDTDYVVTQTPTGKISVYSSLRQKNRETGERAENYGWENKYGSQDVICGSAIGKNFHSWRVRRVNLSDIILETTDKPATPAPKAKGDDGAEEKPPEAPKPNPVAVVGGGAFTVVDVDSKMIFTRLKLGQNMTTAEPLTSGEARRAIYAPPDNPVTEVSTQDKGR